MNTRFSHPFHANRFIIRSEHNTTHEKLVWNGFWYSFLMYSFVWNRCTFCFLFATIKTIFVFSKKSERSSVYGHFQMSTILCLRHKNSFFSTYSVQIQPKCRLHFFVVVRIALTLWGIDHFILCAIDGSLTKTKDFYQISSTCLLLLNERL